MTEEKVTFDLDNFERGARAVFVKDAGSVACEIKASFSIDAKNVVKRYATHSFVEFVNVSTGACLVKTEESSGCLLLITDAFFEAEALREIARRACVETKLPVFLYASAKADMPSLAKVSDKRFEAFSATILSAAMRIMSDTACEK